MALGEIVDRNARKYPHKTAVVFKGRRFTFEEFRLRVNRLANALMALGLSKGDRVGVLAKNCHQYMEVYWAAAKTGLVVVPINYRLVGREIAHIVNNSEPGAMIFEPEFQPALNSAKPYLPSVRSFISTGPPEKGALSYESLLRAGTADDPGVHLSEDDLICIMYTSGTTGSPKGAAMTHRNWLAHTVNMIIELKIGHDDITLNVAPFFHIASIWPMLAHFYMGATNVILERFDPQETLEAFERERVTTCNAVPTMIIQLLESHHLDRYDYSRLRWIGYGASPMPEPVLRKAIGVFGKVFLGVYGLTEASPLLTILPREDHHLEGPPHLVRRLRSCGREVINVQVRVVDDWGSDVLPGQVGEIIAKGDIIIVEYWRNPYETAATIKDGWLYTGDLATVDEEGYIYIVDRKKDIIISGGENISSREVEEVIYSHPAVLEAAVIGVPDERLVEGVHALVVLRPGMFATAEEIVQHCEVNLAGFKKPRSVEFIGELPKSAAGKILKRELRDIYWKRAGP